jgi:hypothetical protein
MIGFPLQLMAAMLRAVPPRPRDYRQRPVVARYPKTKLNRSNKWKPARTYAEARAMSPYPERPVR